MPNELDTSGNRCQGAIGLTRLKEISPVPELLLQRLYGAWDQMRQSVLRAWPYIAVCAFALAAGVANPKKTIWDGVYTKEYSGGAKRISS